jgi:hypothetical protein
MLQNEIVIKRDQSALRDMARIVDRRTGLGRSGQKQTCVKTVSCQLLQQGEGSGWKICVVKLTAFL